jgi:hypothetical protein
MDSFNLLPDVDKKGYIWFVRETVTSETEVSNDLGNDKYYIYFGTRPYASFWEGEHKVIADSLTAIAEAIGLDENLKFNWNDTTTVVDAFDKLKELYDSALKGVSDDDKILSVTEDGKLKSELSIIYTKADESEDGKPYISLLGKGGTALISQFDATDLIKDGMLDEVKLIEEDGKKKLQLTWNTQAGKDVVKLDVTEFLDYYYAGNGLALNAETNEFSIKLAEGEEYLVVDENGIGIDAEKLLSDTINKLVINGTEATVTNRVAEVTITADNISLGTPIMDGESELHPSDKKLSSVLQDIQNAIAISNGGNAVGIVGGNGIDASLTDSNTQYTISLKVSQAEGNLISVDENGVYAAMYYDGDDVEL